MTSAAGACRGAMTATAQNESTSASTRRHTTNAIELSRALRIGRQNRARRMRSRSTVRIDLKMVNEPQMRGPRQQQRRETFCSAQAALAQ
jgi:hypothetical protein